MILLSIHLLLFFMLWFDVFDSTTKASTNERENFTFKNYFGTTIPS